MEAAPIHVRAVKCKVRWTRVDCGWSHSIARGVDEHGHAVVVGWGRNTFGQLACTPAAPPHSKTCTAPSELASAEASADKSAATCAAVASARACVLEPTLLPDLPTGPVDEAWCGSEFTAATDTTGRVFMRGWNEHLNLGGGGGIDGTSATTTTTSSAVWVPVRGANGSQLVLQDYPWPGSLALGGGHCLALGLQKGHSHR
jgi:alpha-tubulin suppressor-like RCC1 family protein